jgi:NAD(P)H-dependent flavin oxidoreductase YrpB (nitropropane dioxygenase family)
MWAGNRICDLFEIEHPIIQAPMMGTCTPELASAVANAGGLGSLGCGEKSPEMIREEVENIRQRTNRSFNLNFFVHPKPKTEEAVLSSTLDRLKPWYDALGIADTPTQLPNLGAGFDDERLQIVLSQRPKVVSFHFGCPDRKYIQEIRAAGIKMISSATSVAEAKYLEDMGMDAVIAQGWEAGGHRGSHTPTEPFDGVGTMALIPQVVDAVSLPVIAAGGIGDGRGIAAAMALGASGVQLGTAFLRCEEAATEPARRKQIANAKDTDTMVTDAFSGRSARAMRSRFSEEMERSRSQLPDFPQMYALSGPVRNTASDADASFFLYGQAASLAREMPAADLVERLVKETEATVKSLTI